VEEAMRYVKAQKLKEKQREEDEKKLFGEGDPDPDCGVIHIDSGEEQGEVKSAVKNGKGEKKKAVMKEDVEMEPAEDIVEDTLWDWTDSNQVGEFHVHIHMKMSLLKSILFSVLYSHHV
jgi:hypothetical protein